MYIYTKNNPHEVMWVFIKDLGKLDLACQFSKN